MQTILGWLVAADRFLAAWAAPLGVHIRNTWIRYFCLFAWALLFFFVGIWSEAFFDWLDFEIPFRDIALNPWIPIAVLTFAYLSLVGVSRAWAHNEDLRGAISKRLADGDPDLLPDLRDEGVVSIILLAAIFPLIFFQANRLAGHLGIGTGAEIRDWLAVTFDGMRRSVTILDFSEVYSWTDLSTLTETAPWITHLRMLLRATFDLVIISGFLQLFKITRLGNEAVEALGRTYENAAYIGSRIIHKLIKVLNNSNDPDISRNAVKAISKIGNPKALPALRKALSSSYALVRRFAAQAIGQLIDKNAKRRPKPKEISLSISALIRATRDENEFVRLRAVQALGLSRDERAREAIRSIADDGRNDKASQEAQRILKDWDRSDLKIEIDNKLEDEIFRSPIRESALAP